ncbi:MAG TPA: alpha/beta fold hydrolase [Terriglobia bacterium]|nr:alpha/beta fold hydrolase [Terriglobia bacterium]
MAVRQALVALLAVLAVSVAATEARAQDFEALGRTLTGELASRQFNKVEAQFDARMAEALPVEKLSTVWDQVLGQVGTFKGVTGARLAEQQGYHIVFVTSEFEHATLDVKVVFDSSGHVAGLFFLPNAAAGQAKSGASESPESDWSPPDYAKPSAFHEQQVTVGGGDWQLPGTLSLPSGNGPFPAVVLVQGSGPQDEDETIGPNKPFKDLAWGLASRGIVVLRYVKRTKEYAAQMMQHPASITVQEETIDDAQAAVTVLAGRREVDPHRIFVLGHSLGGTLAPRIASEDPRVAGIIIMAGGTRPLSRVIVDQVKYIASLKGQLTDAEKAQIAAVEQTEREIESPTLKPTAIIEVLGSPTPGSYWLDLRAYHPAQVAAGLKIPILVLQGGRDYQSTLEDFNGWKKALAGNSRVTLKIYPGLYHLFMPSTSPGDGLGTPADYNTPGHVSEPVMADIAQWMQSGKLQ